MGYLDGFLVTLKQHRIFGGTRVTTPYSGGRVAKQGKDVEGRDEKIAKPERMHGRHVLNRITLLSDRSVAVASSDQTVRIWDTRGPRGRRAARDERRAIRAAVEPVVQRVLAEHPAAAEAVRTLRARPGWTPEQREVALQLVFRPNER